MGTPGICQTSVVLYRKFLKVTDLVTFGISYSYLIMANWRWCMKISRFSKKSRKKSYILVFVRRKFVKFSKLTKIGRCEVSPLQHREIKI